MHLAVKQSPKIVFGLNCFRLTIESSVSALSRTGCTRLINHDHVNFLIVVGLYRNVRRPQDGHFELFLNDPFDIHVRRGRYRIDALGIPARQAQSMSQGEGKFSQRQSQAPTGLRHSSAHNRVPSRSKYASITPEDALPVWQFSRSFTRTWALRSCSIRCFGIVNFA